MPLPPEEAENGENAGNEEPKLQFSYVECLLYSFHQLGRKLPDFLTAKLNAEKLKDFKIRWCIIEVVRSLAKMMVILIFPWFSFPFTRAVSQPCLTPWDKMEHPQTGMYINLWHNKSRSGKELFQKQTHSPHLLYNLEQVPNLSNFQQLLNDNSTCLIEHSAWHIVDTL